MDNDAFVISHYKLPLILIISYLHATDLIIPKTQNFHRCAFMSFLEQKIFTLNKNITFMYVTGAM